MGWGTCEKLPRLLVTTLGFGYVQINGQDVSQAPAESEIVILSLQSSEDILSYAGWTRTDRCVLYRSYEVIKLLNGTAGGNLFVALGCGYRHGPGQVPECLPICPMLRRGATPKADFRATRTRPKARRTQSQRFSDYRCGSTGTAA